MTAFKRRFMVGVAQLAERQVVVLDVVGSSTITHPSVLAGQRPCPGNGAWPLSFQCPILGAKWGRAGSTSGRIRVPWHRLPSGSSQRVDLHDIADRACKRRPGVPQGTSVPLPTQRDRESALVCTCSDSGPPEENRNVW